MMSGEPVLGSLFIYTPNKWAGIPFIIGYFGSFSLHLYQCHHHKSWTLTPLHPLCALLFTLGYILRLYSASSPAHHTYTDPSTFTRNLVTYILGQVFIYVCPPLLELANYHLLGRLLYYVPHQAPVAPGKVVRVFGVVMMVVETLNALGVALKSNATSSETQQEMGANMTLAALGMQLGVIAAFCGLAGLFSWRCAKGAVLVGKVKVVLGVLGVSMGLILVRCVYRLVEHAGNTKVDLGDVGSLKRLSPVLRYEWWFYVFEAALMLVNSLLWNVWHPGRYLPRDYRVYLARDGVTEVVSKADDKDERRWWMKAMHVVTMGLLYGRKRTIGGFGELAELSRGPSRATEDQQLVQNPS